MSDAGPTSVSGGVRKIWRAPQVKVVVVPIITRVFNGGAGDGNTGS